MRHDARARTKLAPENLREDQIEVGGQINRHDSCSREVRGEQLPFDERGAIGDAAGSSCLARGFDLWSVQADTVGACSELQRCGNRDALEGAKIENDVLVVNV